MSSSRRSEPRRISGVLALCLALGAGAGARPALAAEHADVLAAGQTLSMLAVQYYGAAWKSVYISTRNDIDDARDVAAGTRLVIPAGFTYRVRRGDSLADIAKRMLGDADRYQVLMQENGIADAAGLAVGTELLMPFHLRHVVQPGDTWGKIAQRYYRNSKKASTVESYNPGVKALTPGERVTVPIFDRATLDVASRRQAPSKAVARAPRAPTPAPAPPPAAPPARRPRTVAARPAHEGPGAAEKGGKDSPASTPAPEEAPGAIEKALTAAASAVAAVTGSGPADAPPASPPPPAAPPAPAAPAAPQTAGSTRAELAKAIDDYRRGDYDTACPKLDSLLALGGLALADRGTVVSYLGFCSVAYGNRAAALDYFRKWLEIDPAARLDPITTSPKILAVFEQAAEDAGAGADRGR